MRAPQPQITDGAMLVLKGYPWPGNLRELKNALEQGLLLSHGARLCPEHFNWLKPPFRAKEARPLLTLSELKPRHSASVIQVAGGEVDHVAADLGIPRAARCRRLKQLRGTDY
jgi:transcriptional regulator of acetoin/glycerol metabolism